MLNHELIEAVSPVPKQKLTAVRRTLKPKFASPRMPDRQRITIILLSIGRAVWMDVSVQGFRYLGAVGSGGTAVSGM